MVTLLFFAITIGVLLVAAITFMAVRRRVNKKTRVVDNSGEN